MDCKILFTASTVSHIQSFHLPYLRRFRSLGAVVHIACGGEGTIEDAERTILLPFEKKLCSPQNLRSAWMLRRLICEEHYALIITHTSLAAFFTRLAIKGLRVRPRLINVVHGYLFDGETTFLKRELLLAAERVTAPQTDLLLTMNTYDFALAQRFRLGRYVRSIPGMGVDFSPIDTVTDRDGARLREELGIDKDAFIFLYPAEFSRRKSQSVLIRAMSMLPDHAVLVLAGKGELLAECRDLAAQMDLGKRVIFPGHVNNMPVWYRMADAAVSASRSEGLPFNIMEGMYAGLPVAASAVKGHTDLVHTGKTGLLYPYGDVAACAAAMRELMDDPQRSRSMGSLGKTCVEPYALSKVLPSVMEQYITSIET